MTYRVYNFNPGPATLPLPVLEEAQAQLLNYREKGMSITEISHRSREFEEIIGAAETLLLELGGLSTAYQALFLQGGASQQFALVPLNFLPPEGAADYILTGSFAQKAYQEAQRLGTINVAATTKEHDYRRIPRPEELKFSSAPAYVHITTNNTIYGTQWKYIPDTGGVPLMADMSSDIFSGETDLNRFSLLYAGAQKNLGPAGVTVVILKKDLLEKVSPDIPAILSYKTHAEARSLYNTPPVFAIYLVYLVLQWLKKQGGLPAMGKLNARKAALIYQAIDQSGGFYRGHADAENRSNMNITFRLPNEELEKIFVAGAAQEGLVGLKGHRSVGGIRASLYNAMPLQGAETLAQYMTAFYRQNG
ncbi:MAG: 3-phosphoserine/phosphohydroxythreonine transaminase [Firmicutes bacterium]|nr:3-phosphoserine/phosphohydroxythreonine transaminase [Bacillota bacterium]